MGQYQFQRGVVFLVGRDCQHSNNWVFGSCGAKRPENYSLKSGCGLSNRRSTGGQRNRPLLSETSVLTNDPSRLVDTTRGKESPRVFTRWTTKRGKMLYSTSHSGAKRGLVRTCRNI